MVVATLSAEVSRVRICPFVNELALGSSSTTDVPDWTLSGKNTRSSGLFYVFSSKNLRVTGISTTWEFPSVCDQSDLISSECVSSILISLLPFGYLDGLITHQHWQLNDVTQSSHGTNTIVWIWINVYYLCDDVVNSFRWQTPQGLRTCDDAGWYHCHHHRGNDTRTYVIITEFIHNISIQFDNLFLNDLFGSQVLNYLADIS